MSSGRWPTELALRSRQQTPFDPPMPAQLLRLMVWHDSPEAPLWKPSESNLEQNNT
jgi:hypothetical protein